MSERELFELTEVFKERCEGLIFNNGKYEFDRNIEGLSQMKMAILGLNLTVVNSAWHGWQASSNRQGYKLVPVDTLEECLNWASIAEWDSSNKETDAEINHHKRIIKEIIGVVE